MTDDKRYKMVDGELIEMTAEEIAEFERSIAESPKPPNVEQPQPTTE